MFCKGKARQGGLNEKMIFNNFNADSVRPLHRKVCSAGQGSVRGGKLNEFGGKLIFRFPSRSPNLFQGPFAPERFARRPFTIFLGEGSPTKIDKPEKSWYPYPNLTIGGPRVVRPPRCRFCSMAEGFRWHRPWTAFGAFRGFFFG